MFRNLGTTRPNTFVVILLFFDQNVLVLCKHCKPNMLCNKLLLRPSYSLSIWKASHVTVWCPIPKNHFFTGAATSRISAMNNPAFDIATDEEFRRVFLNIITSGSKDNTYKFALARFLIDYCRDNTQTHVEFSTIARYFLEYYWTQICKLKMKHAPQEKKKPMIVQIIEKEFPKPYYPQTFKEICKKEPEKISTCIKRIVKLCFHNVIWRFQRVRVSRATEIRLFFDYNIARVVHSNRKYVDLDYGINLNPKAIEFFRQHDAVLFKSVILEWAKFLENLNVGLPKLILKTEGKNLRRGSLDQYRRLLDPFFAQCFYCDERLQEGSKTHVEHVIPFDYIAEDDIWNLTLVCQKCNCEKLGALPPQRYIDKLIQRNEEFRTKIPKLEKSLASLELDFGKVVKNHYVNAKTQGYMTLNSFRCTRDMRSQGIK